MYKWDPIVNCAIYKDNIDSSLLPVISDNVKNHINKGNKVIAIGGNGDINGYVEIPEGYYIPGYTRFTGHKGIQVVNMYNYKYLKPDDTYGTGTGYFWDCCNIKTWILSPQLASTEIYSGGKSGI